MGEPVSGAQTLRRKAREAHARLREFIEPNIPNTSSVSHSPPIDTVSLQTTLHGSMVSHISYEMTVTKLRTLQWQYNFSGSVFQVRCANTGGVLLSCFSRSSDYKYFEPRTVNTGV